ncbi:Solitary outer membrane autotransporter beta-barrel domain [Psychromonas sp.]|nr:Solitary outer membrane autotransporter beta-barrel domain [Psychromonas sp.]
MKLIKLLLSVFVLLNGDVLASPQQNNMAQIFSTGVLLSDSDAISFGVANFDPKTLLQKHPSEISDSIQLRNQLAVTNLPFNFEVAGKKGVFSDKLFFNLSYVVQKQSTSEPEDDYNKDIIYGFYSAYKRDWILDKSWKLSTGIGQYLMHYENKHNYHNVFSSGLQQQLDGQYFNINSNAYILEPSLGIKYTQQKQSWGYWSYKSKFNYFYGWTFSGNTATRGANPQSWKFANTLKTHLHLFSNTQQLESLYIKAERVDIGGDLPASLGTDYYYEFGLGLLMKFKAWPDFIKNVGIGVNVNLGSSLEGGSLVLYFNEV